MGHGSVRGFQIVVTWGQGPSVCVHIELILIPLRLCCDLYVQVEMFKIRYFLAVKYFRQYFGDV